MIFFSPKQNKGLKRSGFLFLVLTLFLGSIQESFAAEDTTDTAKRSSIYQLAPITVSAQKYNQEAFDIPNSMTVLNEVAIQDARITNMKSLSANVPNLDFYDFGSRRHSLAFMRGIKSIHAGEPAIGYYVDGVNYSKSYMFDFPLFDVERIEILRGPQGTLYGRNTMGGVINIYTRKPGNETNANISGSFGNYKSWKATGSVSTPIIENMLFLGFSAMFLSSDGFIENDVATNDKDGRFSEGMSSRLQLRFYPNDQWDITLAIDGQQHDDGVFAFRKTQRNAFVQKGMFAADEHYHYSNDFEGTSDNSFFGSSLSIVHDLDFGRLTSITGFRDYKNEEMIDTDFSPLDMVRMKYDMDEETFTQEFRLSSAKQHPLLQWFAGLSYFTIDSKKNTTTFYRPAIAKSPSNPFQPGTGSRLAASNGKNEGVAIFGQTTISLLEKLDLTLGLRYEFEEAEMDAARHDTPEGGSTSTTVAPTLENSFNALSPKTSLAWKFTNERMAYFTFSGAHRSGGFNVFGDKGAYDEEYSWLYEFGIKSSFFQRHLIVNIAGFYTDIQDEQITLFDINSNQPYVDNAGASHRLGLELETKAILLPGLDMSASFSWIEAKYDSYNDPGTNQDYEGKHVFGVPDYTFHLALQYRKPCFGEWFLFSRVELSGVGTRYFDDANTVSASPYEVVNLKLGLESQHIDFYMWSNNLFDRHFTLFENVKKGIAEDGQPQMLGVTMNYRL